MLPKGQNHTKKSALQGPIDAKHPPGPVRTSGSSRTAHRPPHERPRGSVGRMGGGSRPAKCVHNTCTAHGAPAHSGPSGAAENCWRPRSQPTTQRIPPLARAHTHMRRPLRARSCSPRVEGPKGAHATAQPSCWATTNAHRTRSRLPHALRLPLDVPLHLSRAPSSTRTRTCAARPLMGLALFCIAKSLALSKDTAFGTESLNSGGALSPAQRQHPSASAMGHATRLCRTALDITHATPKALRTHQCRIPKPPMDPNPASPNTRVASGK